MQIARTFIQILIKINKVNKKTNSKNITHPICRLWKTKFKTHNNQIILHKHYKKVASNRFLCNRKRMNLYKKKI